MRLELIAFLTIARRELRRIVRIWGQTLVPPAITMALYFIIFGRLIGERLGPVGGHSYIDFIVPGLVMMSVITNAYGNVSSSFFGAKFGRYVEEFMVAPLSPLTLLLGYLAGALLRGILVGGLVLIVALFFTRLSVADLGVTLLALIAAALIFGLAGFINAIYAKKFDDISIIPTFVLTPSPISAACSIRSRCCPRLGGSCPSPIRSFISSMPSATACSARATSRSRSPSR